MSVSASEYIKAESRSEKFNRYFERLRYGVRHPIQFLRLRNRCRNRGFIFIHIPKCAGTSVRESLHLPGAHRTLASYQTILTPELFERCFKFTFVRNPWDRLVSAFYYLKNRDMKSNQRWAKENLSEFETFDAFVRGWVNRKSIWTYSHFRPQFQFICLKGCQPAVDFVGYYENFVQDFSLICERLKINAEVREENRNTLRSRDYRECYTDETRQMIAEVYREDIELFGYSFDNALLARHFSERLTQGVKPNSCGNHG